VSPCPTTAQGATCKGGQEEREEKKKFWPRVGYPVGSVRPLTQYYVQLRSGSAPPSVARTQSHVRNN